MEENSFQPGITSLTAQSTDATGDGQAPGLLGMAQSHELESSVTGKIDNTVDASRYQLTAKLPQPPRLRNIQ